ncbi:MAG: ABC transporter permease [Enterocloster asparagiformis]|nr:ABC transporter permease [Enterocloster asparagiformis]
MTAGTKTLVGEEGILKKKGQLRVIWMRYCRSRLAVFGLIIFSVMLLLVLSADLYMDYDTNALKMNMSEQYLAPSMRHLMGTDSMGRDYFARVIYGGRISMFVGVATVIFALLVGGLIGAVAAYYGGKLENILMRIMDVFLAIPPTLLALTIIATVGSGISTLVIAMGISQTPRMARIVRSAVLGVKGSDYVEAARACGTSNARIILRHIIPNAMGPILVQATQTVARSVLIISSLSFIGLGVSEPTPEWGSMLSTVKTQMRYYPHLAIAPGIAMGLSVLSLTLIGDGLRDAMDPRLRN